MGMIAWLQWVSGAILRAFTKLHFETYFLRGVGKIRGKWWKREAQLPNM